MEEKGEHCKVIQNNVREETSIDEPRESVFRESGRPKELRLAILQLQLFKSISTCSKQFEIR